MQSLLETNERLVRLQADKDEYKSNVISVRQHVDELLAERSALQAQIVELNDARAVRFAFRRSYMIHSCF